MVTIYPQYYWITLLSSIKRVVYFDYSYNLIITNIYLSCIGNNLNGYSGIYLYENDNIILSNIFILHGAFGIDISTSRYIYIYDSIIYNLITYYGALKIGSVDHCMIHNVSIYNITNMNSMNADGAGIDIYDSHSITFIDITVADCLAYGNGGGIALRYGNLLIKFVDIHVYNNSAIGKGGGIYIGDSNEYVFFLNKQSNYYSNTLTLSSSTKLQCEKQTFPFLAESVSIFFDSSTSFDDKLISLSSNAASEIANSLFAFSGRNRYIYDTESDNQIPGINIEPWTFDSIDNINVCSHISDDITVTMYILPIFISEDYSNIIENNRAGSDGGGIYISRANPSIVCSSIRIVNNYAKSHGGGIVIQNTNRFGTYIHMNILNNNCTSDGGGMYIGFGNDHIKIIHSIIEYNEASQEGGGVFLFTNNGDSGSFEIDYSQINHNIARNGGGIYADQQNNVTISGTEIIDNHVTWNGGGIYIGQENEVMLQGTTVVDNDAINYGGGVYSEGATLTILEGTDVHINNSVASHGAGVFAYQTNINLGGTLIAAHNKAYEAGGGVLLLQSYCHCKTEIAGECHMSFISNEAVRGPGLFLAKTTEFLTEKTHLSILFSKNHAHIGATVYWVIDNEIMKEHPKYFDSPNIIWLANTETYGMNISTQPLKILTNESVRVPSDGSPFDPPMHLLMHDFYHNLVKTETIHPFHATVALHDAHCDKNTRPYFSGADSNTIGINFVNGSAVFDDLRGYCYPGGTWVTVFSVPINAMDGISSDATITTLTANVSTMFNQCKDGEHVVDTVCTICPEGSFSFKYVSDETECKLCGDMDGVSSCSGKELILKSGYWRSANDSLYIKSCPKKGSSCEGGFSGGEASCAKGYTGPLCDVCDYNYYATNEQCKKCELSPRVVLIVIVVGTCFVVLLVVIWFFWSMKVQKATEQDEPTRDESAHLMPSTLSLFDVTISKTESEHGVDQIGEGDNEKKEEIVSTTREDAHVSNSFAETDEQSAVSETEMEEQQSSFFPRIKTWIKKWKTSFDKIITRLKIVIATYQVVVASAYVFQVDMPFTFTSFTRTFKFVNFNIADNITIDCWKPISFYYKLLWATVTPLICIITVVIVCFVHAKYFDSTPYKSQHIEPTRNNEEDSTNNVNNESNNSMTKSDDIVESWFLHLFHKDIVTNYLNVIFYITYLVLPSVTTMIFQVFDCVTIDAAGKDSYLRIDMSISCDTDDYRGWMWFAIVMIIVYPVGIPLFYFVCLYQVRDAISNRALSTEISRKVKERSKEEGKAKAALAFLWAAYEPCFWYWEIIETFRRIMLTAVLSILAPGSSKQNVFGIVLTFLFTKLYGFYQPYLEDNDDLLADLGQVQIFFTFFATLIFSQHILNPQLNAMVSGLLVAINLLVIFVGFYFELLNNETSQPIVEPLKRLFEFNKRTPGYECDSLELAIMESSLELEHYELLKKVIEQRQCAIKEILEKEQKRSSRDADSEGEERVLPEV